MTRLSDGTCGWRFLRRVMADGFAFRGVLPASRPVLWGSIMWPVFKRLAVAAAVAVVALSTVLSRAAWGSTWKLSASSISGPVVLASGCGDDEDESAPQIAVDPRDPSDLAATYAIGDGSASVLALSGNGGRSWSRSPIRGTLSCDGGGAYGYRFDPDLAFAPDGRLYVTESVQSSGSATGTSGIDDLLLSAAPGAGALGAAVPVVPANPISGAQRGFLAFPAAEPDAVDLLTERLDYAGQYVPFGSSLQFVSSSSAGATLTARTIYTAPVDEAVVAEGLLRVGRTLLAFGELEHAGALAGMLGLTSTYEEQAIVLSSDDDGVTWLAPQVVFTHDVGSDGLSDCCLLRPTLGPGGTIYWPDANDGQITVYRSVAGTDDWSALPLSGVSDVSEPTVAAGPDGRLAVAFYQLGSDSQTATVQLALSSDRGTTWQLLSLGSPFKLSSLGPVDDTSQLGPVQGIAATPDGFVAAMTVGGSLVTAGGGSDVDLIKVSPMVPRGSAKHKHHQPTKRHKRPGKSPRHRSHRSTR